LSSAGSFANLQSYNQTVASAQNPYLRMRYDFQNPAAPAPTGYEPDFDLTAILSSDTVGTWLNRIDTRGYTWALNAFGFWETDGSLDGNGNWLCSISSADLVAIKESLGLVVPPTIAPVWPGLAHVTLGTPVAFTGPTNVNVPMHGILIEIDSVPPGKPTYVFGSQTATAHIGAIAFIDDDQEMEYPQNLSFNYQVYCVQSMVIAGGVKLRCVPGVTGIITPWTIT